MDIKVKYIRFWRNPCSGHRLGACGFMNEIWVMLHV